MRKNPIAIAAIAVAIVLACAGVGMMFSVTSLAPTHTETPTPQPTATAKIPHPTGKRTELETAAGTEPKPTDTFGEINVSYPVRFSVGSSDVVRVLVQRPPALASLGMGDFDRIPIPPDAPPIIGATSLYRATILIWNQMRLELTSPTFSISPIYPAEQSVNTDPGADPAVWAWTVVAPETPGLHVLVLQVFLGDDTAPVWGRSFQVEVVGTDALATPTPPPPFIERPGGKVVIGAITTIIAALIGLFGTLVGKGIILKPKERE